MGSLQGTDFSMQASIVVEIYTSWRLSAVRLGDEVSIIMTATFYNNCCYLSTFIPKTVAKPCKAVEMQNAEHRIHTTAEQEKTPEKKRAPFAENPPTNDNMSFS